MADRLSRAIQQNLLTLLCFDDERCKLIRNSVSHDLFESIYSDIALRAYEHIDEFGVAPKEHLPDLFDDILEGDDKNKSNAYKRAFFNLYESKDSVDPTYSISSLTKFVREQKLKIGIMDASRLLLEGNDGALDEAEVILSRAMKDRIDLFDPGTFLSDTDRSLQFLNRSESSFAVGIPILDNFNLGPGRKKLHLFIALAKRGKTWWLCNIGKKAILQRLKVVHLSLEMSEEEIAQRYYQSLFGMAKRKGKYPQTVFEFKKLKDPDSFREFKGLRRKQVRPALSLDDPEIAKKLRAKSKRWGMRFNNLIIKEFPTGQLTTKGLEAYLDSLEQSEKFIPDILLLDYADLMYVDSRNYRHDLGRVYKDIRGIAVERNIAIATASQSNRDGLGRRRIDEGNVAEDFSKIAISDVTITYNQTPDEKELGLARLYVATARSDVDQITILIAQNYAFGQFVLDSTMMTNKYWDEIDEIFPKDDND